MKGWSMLAPFYKRNEKNDSEENNFNQRFGDCNLFTNAYHKVASRSMS